MIKNGRIWNGFSMSQGDVFIENGIISQIGLSESTEVDYEFDATGCIVSSGLVDIHTHMRGISADVFGTQAEMACFPFGVTAAADVSGKSGNEQMLDAFQVKSAIFVGAHIKENRVDLADLEKRLKLFGERAVGVKTFLDSVVPSVTDTQPLKVICEYAHKRDLKVMIHCSGTPVPMNEVLACLDKGDICTHAYHGRGHTALEDHFASLKEAKLRGVIIDAGMAGGVHTDFEVLRAAVNCGALPDTISTDITKLSVYTRGGRYGLTMCMSMLRTLGMSEEEILRAVTSSAASALNRQSIWGVLEVGRAADVAVLKYGDYGFDITDRAGKRLMDDKGYCCQLTIVDGQVVYRH